MKRRRVVVTGLGVVAPNGIGKEAFWDANVAGRSGVRTISRFDASNLLSRIAGEVADFEPLAYGLTPLECNYMDRGTQFAIAASTLALDDGNLTALSEDERDNMGVYIGNAMAYVEEAEKFWMKITDNGEHEPRLTEEQRDFIPVSLLMTHASATTIAAHHQLHGPCTVIATGCSAGADAIGEAVWAIQEGRVDRMLAGGTDSSIFPMGITVFTNIGAMSTRNDEPECASRPYDGNRDGFVMAEGAAVLLLEERELA
ncbi:MAG TPA: hypothetical protein DHW02_19315, partial [Ktedonobacter sp.]|nr:hypothetical protein [Ktedonobacter sp.]